MLVAYIGEEVYLVLVEEQGSSDRVYWGIAPALVVEATLLVEEGEIFTICFATPEVEVGNFKVGPEVAVVISRTADATQDMNNTHNRGNRGGFNKLTYPLLVSSSEMNPSELFFATYSGCSFANSCVVDHSDSMVSRYSGIAMTKEYFLSFSRMNVNGS